MMAANSAADERDRDNFNLADCSDADIIVFVKEEAGQSGADDRDDDCLWGFTTEGNPVSYSPAKKERKQQQQRAPELPLINVKRLTDGMYLSGNSQMIQIASADTPARAASAGKPKMPERVSSSSSPGDGKEDKEIQTLAVSGKKTREAATSTADFPEKITSNNNKTTTTVDLILYKETQCQTDGDGFFSLDAAFGCFSPLPDLSYLDNVVHNDGEDSIITDISNNTRQQLQQPQNSDGCSEKVSRLKQQFLDDLKGCAVKDVAGNLPIHVAVLKNNPLDVKRQCLILKARKVNINVPTDNGLTPLQLAILNNVDLQIIAVLLENGGDISAMDSGGNNIVHLAVMYTENFQDIRLSCLMNVARKIKFDINQFNYEGCTALIICAMQKKKEMATILLENGADPNIRDQKSGRTALFHAVENNDLDMVELLLKFGANQKVRNFFGTSPHDAMFELESVKREIKELVLGKDLFQMKPAKLSKADKKRRKTPVGGVKRPNDDPGEEAAVNLGILTPVFEYTPHVVKQYAGKKLKIIPTYQKVEF